MCTRRTHAAGTVRKLVHMKRIGIHFYVATRTALRELCTRCDRKTEDACILFSPTASYTFVKIHSFLRKSPGNEVV